MTTRTYLAAELASQIREADLQFWNGFTSWPMFELRRRGLLLLAERHGIAHDVRQELAVLEASR